MKYLYIQYFFLSILLAGCFTACSPKKIELPPAVDSARRSKIDSIENLLGKYSFAGKHDSVIFVARPVLSEAISRKDTSIMVYVGLNMAQSFLFMGNMDSVQRYIDMLEPLKDYPVPTNLRIMHSNLLGSYSLRSSLDYSKALNYYIEGLNWANQENNCNNRIALLSNIVNIFYVQNSDKGFEYAREAYDLAMTHPGISLYAKCAACIVMAQMHYVKCEYAAAARFLEKADTYAQQGKALSQMPFIYAMFAWIAQQEKDYDKASEFYVRAIDFIRYTDPGTASQIYLTYGDFLAIQGDKTAAAAMYRKGLEVSDTSGNVEFRKSLLGHIADLAYDMGDYLSAARYSRMYKAYSDTISTRREKEFRELIVAREESELQRIMLAKELEHEKTEQRFLTLLFVFIGVSGFSFLLFLLYYRQRKMYGKLVKKHQEYISLLDLKSNCNNDTHNNTDRELFSKIEHFMRDEKVYRMKNLTLEMLADMTDSNRTYCSRAINTFSGMSFNRYLDSFRITEATKIIADSCDSVLFKQLADDIGYNSVAVFSRAFQRETGCSPSIYRKEVRGYRPE